MAYQARNYSSTTPPTQITTNIDNSVNTTNIAVQSTSGYPAAPFTGCFERNTLNQEFVLVTAVPDANHFTVVRGYDGTPPAQHLAPATFEHCVGAIDYREANQHHTNTAQDDHLQYLLTSGARPATGPQSFPQGLSANYLAVSGFPAAYVLTRYVGGTGPSFGPPGGGTFQVGDWVLDPGNTRWMCVAAGSPGTWVPEPGRVVAHYQNTTTLPDAANSIVTVTTLTFTAVKNISYVVEGCYQGTIITAAPSWTNAILYSSPSIFAYNSYIQSTSGAAYVVGNVVAGTTVAQTTPTTANTSVQIKVNIQSAGSGGMRTGPGGLEITVRRA